MPPGHRVTRAVTKAAVAAAILTAAVLPAGCGGSSDALGGGAEVDVCGGYEAYDDLPEVDPADRAEVNEWAAGFLRVTERTETDRPVTDRDGDRRDVPQAIVSAFDALERSVTEYKSRMAEAAGKGPDEVRRAADSLALDDRFRDADVAVRTFYEETCR